MPLSLRATHPDGRCPASATEFVHTGPHFGAQLCRFDEIRASSSWSLVCALPALEGLRFLVATHWATLTSSLRLSFSRIDSAVSFCRLRAMVSFCRFSAGHRVQGYKGTRESGRKPGYPVPARPLSASALSLGRAGGAIALSWPAGASADMTSAESMSCQPDLATARLCTRIPRERSSADCVGSAVGVCARLARAVQLVGLG